jgi:hypothetical protein
MLARHHRPNATIGGMAPDPPAKRSDDETEVETVKRRLIDAVREQSDDIQQSRGIVSGPRVAANEDA